MQDNTILLFVVGIFAVAALLLIIGQKFSKEPVVGVWKLYWSQLVVTAWMVIPAWLGGVYFKGAVMVMIAITTWELYSVLRTMGAGPFRLAGLLASLSYGGLVLFGQYQLLLWAVLLFAMGLLLFPLFAPRIDGLYNRASATLFGTLFPGLCLSFALRLPDLHNPLGDFLFLYGVLEVNDAFAFLFGRYLGKRKLSKISPNKTVIGTLGGIFSATVVAAFASVMMPGFTVWQCAAIGAVLGVIGMSADLVASAIKRQAGVKDYSNIAPPQGGMLDLYDAFIFTVPLWYAFLSWIR